LLEPQQVWVLLPLLYNGSGPKVWTFKCWKKPVFSLGWRSVSIRRTYHQNRRQTVFNRGLYVYAGGLIF